MSTHALGSRTPLPISGLTHSVLENVRGVFCDIDDTLTTHGKLTAEAYAAMEALQFAGKWVIPVTGRPAGWCDHFARMWPVDAVVGENGAFYFFYDTIKRSLVKRFFATKAERQCNRQRLDSVCERILREIPGAALATDQLYREADLAIDFCEDVPRLDDEEVNRIVAIMQESGMTAKVSSIHVNGWFGDYDKLGITKLLMKERFSLDLDLDRQKFIFVGDSPNDSPMFDYFPYSVGVANVADFTGQMAATPRFVTTLRCGGGFAELAKLIVGAAVK